MIGLAACIYLLFNGRIMGASGIVGGLVDRTAGSSAVERIIFLAGLVGAPLLMAFAVVVPPTNLTDNILVIVAGGVLVGLGTRIGNGCTSGHGVCGISRLSMRGLVATLCYLGAGFICVALLRHVWGII